MIKIDVNNYNVEQFIMTDYIFLDIRDKRNGEMYCFYKHKTNDKHYIFHNNYQEWGVYSKEAKTVWKDRDKNPFDFETVFVAKKRPQNPFEQFAEYNIQFTTNGHLVNVEEIV